jgi:hypothetical protein
VNASLDCGAVIVGAVIVRLEIRLDALNCLNPSRDSALVPVSFLSAEFGR